VTFTSKSSNRKAGDYEATTVLAPNSNGDRNHGEAYFSPVSFKQN
jgi:hypothetical protein